MVPCISSLISFSKCKMDHKLKKTIDDIIFSLILWPLTFSRDIFIALHFCKVWRGFYSFPLQFVHFCLWLLFVKCQPVRSNVFFCQLLICTFSQKKKNGNICFFKTISLLGFFAKSSLLVYSFVSPDSWHS